MQTKPRRTIKCSFEGCEELIRYDSRRGVCRKHTDWSKHSARMSEYNVSQKTKPDNLKYRTDRIYSIDSVCIICGNPFKTTPEAVKRGGGNVCSDKCHGIRAAKLTPKKKTSIEVAIENELILCGIEYVEQYPLCGITVVDFYIPSTKTVIYCDGDYWHSIPKRVKSDKLQNKVLTENGYKVFRFSETDIKRSPAECVARIYNG